jgi:hypothetical protein
VWLQWYKNFDWVGVDKDKAYTAFVVNIFLKTLIGWMKYSGIMSPPKILEKCIRVRHLKLFLSFATK